MLSKVIVSPADFEDVYSWLKATSGIEIQVWGLAGDRRVALLACCDGPTDRFGWSNWVSDVLTEPSEILDGFTALEIELDRNSAIKLWSALPWAVTAVPDAPDEPRQAS
jgi:hypothetical protein